MPRTPDSPLPADSPSPTGVLHHPTPTVATGQRRGLRVAALLSAAAPAALAITSLSSPLPAVAAPGLTASITGSSSALAAVDDGDPCVQSNVITWPLGPSALKAPDCAGD